VPVGFLGAPCRGEGALPCSSHLVLDLRAPGRIHGTLLDGFVAHDEYDSDDADHGYSWSDQ
jgi:hypothetical protein